MADNNAKVHANKHDEYYTPIYLLEMCQEVLGSIDLDPSTCNKAIELTPKHLRAPLYFTMDNPAPAIWPVVENIWCNPPFSKTRQFIDSAMIAAGKGSTTVFLMPANMATLYIQKIFTDLKSQNLLSPILFHNGRIHFYDGVKNAINKNPPGSTLLFMIGDMENKVVKEKVARFKSWSRQNSHIIMEML